jgi:excisionase family DNA binding protein
MSKLINIFQLAELSGLPVRTWRTLVQKRAIPFIKVGHRTMLFQPEKVLKALEKFEVKGV